MLCCGLGTRLPSLFPFLLWKWPRSSPFNCTGAERTSAKRWLPFFPFSFFFLLPCFTLMKTTQYLHDDAVTSPLFLSFSSLTVQEPARAGPHGVIRLLEIVVCRNARQRPAPLPLSPFLSPFFFSSGEVAEGLHFVRSDCTANSPAREGTGSPIFVFFSSSFPNKVLRVEGTIHPPSLDAL